MSSPNALEFDGCSIRLTSKLLLQSPTCVTLEISPSPSEVIPPAKPYFPRSDIETIKENVEKILSSGRLTLGEYTREFEGQFAKLAGVKYAVAVNSGTSALEISLRCQGLKHRDEVILPTNTFGDRGHSSFCGGETSPRRCEQGGHDHRFIDCAQEYE